ncbi:MAG: hypothetical protein ACREID_06790, partial [Planctomycetota bacterium]
LEAVPGEPLRLSARVRGLAVAALGDRHEDVRFNAAILLAGAGDGATALPTLKKMIDRRHLETFDFDKKLEGADRQKIHSNLIRAAIEAVAALRVGEDAEVLAALERLSDDATEWDSDVRERARAALRKLKAPAKAN